MNRSPFVALALLAAALIGPAPSADATCVTATIQEGPIHLADAQAGDGCQPWVVVYFCQVRYFGGSPPLEWTCAPLLEGPVTGLP